MAISVEEVVLAVLILLTALLYSSVGHGGASGYLAAMALLGLAPEVMRPTALLLNILVATIALVRFFRAGAFSWNLFWPLALASIPCAYVGGTITLPGHFYKPLVGIVLMVSAWHILHTASRSVQLNTGHPPFPILMLLGASIGWLSGLTGVGGGIFISPLLLYFRWALARVVSGVVAAFVLVNSIAGLFGEASAAHNLPAAMIYWGIAACVGGWIGAEYGSRHISNATIRMLLGLVLIIAGLKLFIMSLLVP